MILPAGHPDTVRFARALAAFMAETRDALSDEQYAAVLPSLAELTAVLPENSRSATAPFRSAQIVTGDVARHVILDASPRPERHSS